MKRIQVVALLCLIVLLKSCNSIDFDPQFHVPSIADQSIIYCSEVNDRDECVGIYNEVDYYDQEIENYACMSESKIKELIEILTRARMPKRVRSRLISKLKNY